ncbi:MAG: tRNA 2-selenouridine(34) synthase MnmH [Pseudomonadota bacterium]
MQTDDYRGILLGNCPLLDVRAPVEFAKGAFPGAVNLPLMDDRERQRVGTAYNRDGHDAAVALGHELVSGALREGRIDGWVAFCEAHPDGLLYCFRGGERSAIVQRWLAERGVEITRISGGYKAMRRWLIDQTERLCDAMPITLVGGRTGTGKTEVLVRLSDRIDLEGLANHRGSGFGRRATPQPPPIEFENRLAIDWLRLEALETDRVVMEDESRCIGRCALPEPLWDRFQEAPIALIEEDVAARVARIRREYTEAAVAEFEGVHPGEGFDRYAAHLLASLDRIQRRLGGKAHAELRKLMGLALEAQRDSGDATGHDAWIERLLRDYYDPMYDYQLERKRERVVFRGSGDEVIDFIEGLS